MSPLYDNHHHDVINNSANIPCPVQALSRPGLEKRSVVITKFRLYSTLSGVLQQSGIKSLDTELLYTIMFNVMLGYRS